MKEPISISIDYTGHLIVDGEVQIVRFTRTEAKFLEIVLASRGVVTKDYAMSRLYDNVNDEPALKILDVFLTKVKKKLGEHRVAIETVWGRGWARSAGYVWEKREHDMVLLEVRQDRISDLVLFTGKPAEVILDDLIERAHKEMLGSAI